MNRIRFAIAAAALAALAGCSSLQGMSDAVPAPAGQIYGKTRPAEGDARLTLYRINDQAGSLCYFTVMVDGERVARLFVKETAVVYVKPGARRISVTLDWSGKGFCNWPQDHCEKQAFHTEAALKAGGDHTFQFGHKDLKFYTIFE
ncbi:MAG: hypothetical protein HUK26_08130 [Duodenibacillus sp.]|nr:hypothetical protein [Duodenibacillus sp.]